MTPYNSLVVRMHQNHIALALCNLHRSTSATKHIWPQWGLFWWKGEPLPQAINSWDKQVVGHANAHTCCERLATNDIVHVQDETVGTTETKGPVWFANCAPSFGPFANSAIMQRRSDMRSNLNCAWTRDTKNKTQSTWARVAVREELESLYTNWSSQLESQVKVHLTESDWLI